MPTGQLIINPMGGLANRMRAMASGLSLARDVSGKLLGGNTNLIVPRFVWLKNWELNAEFTDIFELPEFLDGRIEYPSQLKYDLLYSAPRKKNLYLSALTCRRYGAVLHDLRDSDTDLFDGEGCAPRLVSLIADNFRHGKSCLIRGCTVFYPFGQGFYASLFRPTDEIAALVTDRLAQLGQHKIGIHIRRSDNLESIAGSPDELFIAKIDEILADDPDTRFYLATDDETVKIRFKGLFGSHIVTGTSKADRNSVAGIKEAAVELFTLAGTDRIYGSYYSSFSEAAALLGNQPYTALAKEG